MSTDRPATERPANFFRNYNRLVGFTYVSIVFLTLGFFLHQIHLKRTEEINSILGHVERHGQLIEFVLRNSVDYLEASRITAIAFYATSSADDLSTPPLRSRLFSQIRTTADSSHFNLDTITEPDSTGNLTGDGRFADKTQRFYRDVEMALELAQDFQAINLNLPNAVSTRFVGVEQFSYVFPWQESSKERFAASDYSTSAWRMGTPEDNPTRGKYWASVHYGGKDKGLLAPVSAPIYDGDSFRGVLSIDTSLDYLNRLNGDFGYSLGTAMLVDADARVLAHPEFFSDPLNVKEVPAFSMALPPGLDKNDVLSLPARTPTEIGGQIIIRYPFLNAPWNLVYILPSSDLSAKLFAERGVERQRLSVCPPAMPCLRRSLYNMQMC